jgi:DNA polymerase-3 subunit epsilon
MNAFDPHRPLADTAFVVFDVETTGLNPAFGHRVCEIACQRLRDGQELARFDSLVDPQRAVSAGAFRVNQITAEMLQGAPTFDLVADSILEIMEGAVLVAHNAPFDLGFLAAELEIARRLPPEGPVLDTLTLARRVYSFPRNSLGAVSAALEVETGVAHRAMGDVETTSNVLERMLWDLDRRWGATTLGQILSFQGGSIPYPVSDIPPLPPAIAEALERRGRVRMRYVDARGQETERSVRPLRVQGRQGYLYLIAHCYRAEALRTFRLDRVVDMTFEE